MLIIYYYYYYCAILNVLFFVFVALTIIREFSIHWLVIVIIIGLICLMLVVSAFACKQRRDRLQKIKSKKTAVSVENRLYHGGAKEDLNLLIPYDENIEFPRSK